MLGLSMQLESCNPNPFCTWLEHAQGCFASLLSVVFPREGASNRLLDSLQPECEQVSLGAEPSCPWASRHPGTRRQAARAHGLEVEAKPLGSCKGPGILTFPRKEHFIKTDSGEQEVSLCSAEQLHSRAVQLKRCPRGTAVHPSQAEGAVSGFSISSVPWGRPGWLQGQPRLTLPAISPLARSGWCANASHSVVNPALPTAKLHSACGGRGAKSLWNLPFPSTLSFLCGGPWPCSHLQFPSLQQRGAFGENSSLCLCV